jgi:hypothetical protein
MLVLGGVVFVIEYVVLPINDLVVYTVLGPVGEELLKSSVFLLFLVSYVEYRVTRERSSKLLAVDASVFFLLVVFILADTEVMYPGNSLSGVNLVMLFVKKLGGHFALTVCGCMVFGWWYQRGWTKSWTVLVIGGSVGVSSILHSLVNQLGLGVFLGTMLQGIGVSQELFLTVIFVFALILFLMFLEYKERRK